MWVTVQSEDTPAFYTCLRVVRNVQGTLLFFEEGCVTVHVLLSCEVKNSLLQILIVVKFSYNCMTTQDYIH